MAGRAYTLATNVSVVANSAAQTIVGGIFALVIKATTFPTQCFLQTQAPDGTWINVNALTITSNQVISLNLPSGQYQLQMSGGSVSGLYATLVSIPYDN
jgi:hypothetical protein